MKRDLFAPFPKENKPCIGSSVAGAGRSDFPHARTSEERDGNLAKMAFMCKKDSEREQKKAGAGKGEDAQMSIAARSMAPKPAFSA